MNEINIPSPCTTKCKINYKIGLCTGCFRSEQEIVMWGGLDNTIKKDIIKQLHIRRSKINGTPIRRKRRRM